MKLKIEKGIPIPSPRERGVTAELRKLEIGDSLLIPRDGRNIYNLAKNAGIKVAVRQQPDGTHRIWRVK